MLNRVELQQTVYPPEVIVQALIEAWYFLFKEIPSEDSIGVLYAQNALETGYSEHMYNNNIGNIKAIDKSIQVINYVNLKDTWEIIDGKKVILPNDSPGSRFLAFETLKEGCIHHLEFLKTTRFSKAWGKIIEGNPAEFVQEIKAQKYFTGDLNSYRNSVVWIFNKYKRDKLYLTAMDNININTIPLNIPITVEYPTKEEAKLDFSWLQKLITWIMNLLSK